MGHGHKFPPERAHVLEDPERSLHLDPGRVLDLAGVKPGDVVLDVGCGTGYFARPAARRTGAGGAVWCADIEPRMLDEARRRAEAESIQNMRFLQTSEDGIPGPSGSVDVALLANVLHELNGEGTLREIRRLLRTTGALLVVDWTPEPSPMGPPLHHRYTLPQAERVVTQAGFRLTTTSQAGPHHFAMRFEPR